MSMYMPDILAILYEFFFIGGKLFYNTVMVSAVLQRISVITIYISLPLEPSSPPHATPQVITEHQTGLPVLYISFLLVI